MSNTPFISKQRYYDTFCSETKYHETAECLAEILHQANELSRFMEDYIKGRERLESAIPIIQQLNTGAFNFNMLRNIK